MSTVNSKHQPRRTQSCCCNLPLIREVEIPSRIEKADHEGEAVVFGQREPADGRYDTVSRQSYLSPKREPISNERQARAEYMNSKHFYWGSPDAGLMVSESRGAHSSPRGSREGLANQNRQNALLMTTSSLFISKRDQDEWRRANTTHRTDYESPNSGLLRGKREESHGFKQQQQGTHFMLGANDGSWATDYRTNYVGRTAPRVPLSITNTASAINIGDSTVSPADVLQSLKKLDFVAHQVKPNPHHHGREVQGRNAMVLGYAKNNTPCSTTQYRGSYRPTQFVSTVHRSETCP